MIQKIMNLLLLRYAITKAISLEVIHIFEGEVDLSNIPKLSTHIRINGEMYSIVTPNFEKTKGKVKLKTLFNANVYEDQKISYTVNSQSDIKGEGNVGLHMQRFDSVNYQENLKQYEEFSDFTYKYLNELLKEKKSVNMNVIKNLSTSYVYFGSLTQGKNPQNELMFNEESSLQEKHSSIRAISSARSEGKNDDSFNYAVTNLNRQSTGNNFQHHFSVIKGEIPDSLIQIETFNQSNYLVSNIDSQTLSKNNQEVTFAQTEGSSQIESYGYSEQLTASYRDEDILETRGKSTTVSIKKEFYLNKLRKLNCEFGVQNPNSRVLEVSSSFLLSSSVERSKIFQCLYMVKIYNSLVLKEEKNNNQIFQQL